MKKALLVFDGPAFSEAACEFARMMNETEQLMITGIFLPQYDYAAALASASGGIAVPIYDLPVLEEDIAVMEKNVARFKTWCINNGIEFKVHKDFTDFAMAELEKETIFADLLIIGSEMLYEENEYANLHGYLRDILHLAQCPVFVIPENCGFPQINILAYDGNESSVYAIKQFAYLFPKMSSNKTFLVYINAKTEKELPDEAYIEELATKHYSDLTVIKLNFDPKKAFSFWASDKKGALVVTGSFGRSGLSRFFKQSFATELIKKHKTPVFIAHH